MSGDLIQWNEIPDPYSMGSIWVQTRPPPADPQDANIQYESPTESSKVRVVPLAKAASSLKGAIWVERFDAEYGQFYLDNAFTNETFWVDTPEHDAKRKQIRFILPMTDEDEAAYREYLESDLVIPDELPSRVGEPIIAPAAPRGFRVPAPDPPEGEPIRAAGRPKRKRGGAVRLTARQLRDRRDEQLRSVTADTPEIVDRIQRDLVAMYDYYLKQYNKSLFDASKNKIIDELDTAIELYRRSSYMKGRQSRVSDVLGSRMFLPDPVRMPPAPPPPPPPPPPPRAPTPPPGYPDLFQPAAVLDTRVARPAAPGYPDLFRPAARHDARAAPAPVAPRGRPEHPAPEPGAGTGLGKPKKCPKCGGSKYTDALKEYNAGKSAWCLPRKGTEGKNRKFGKYKDEPYNP
jgi:hypothetical protein